MERAKAKKSPLIALKLSEGKRIPFKSCSAGILELDDCA
jgi:hypothetical protein